MCGCELVRVRERVYAYDSIYVLCTNQRIFVNIAAAVLEHLYTKITISMVCIDIFWIGSSIDMNVDVWLFFSSNFESADFFKHKNPKEKQANIYIAW